MQLTMTLCLFLFSLFILVSSQQPCMIQPSSSNPLQDFKSCISKCSSNGYCPIEFESGNFNFIFHGSSTAGVRITDINNLHIYGSSQTKSKSKIIIHGLNGLFAISNCNNFTIENLVFDMYRLPFTFGKVISVNNETQQFTLQFNETEYQFEPNPYLNDGEDYKWLMNVQAIMGYDIVWKHPLYPDIYTSDSMVKSVTINKQDASKSTMIIQSDSNGVHQIQNDMYLIVRHQVYAFNFMSISSSRDIYLNDITVYSMPGMGVFSTKCHNIYLYRVQFVKYNNRPMSLCADATHFAMNTGNILINESIFEGQGDDGLNVHNFFFQIDSKISSNSLYLQSRVNGSSIVNMVTIGDIYEFRNRHSLQPYFTAKMINITSSNIAEFDVDIPSTMNIYDVITSITSLPTNVYIMNSIYHSNRARGTLLKVSNVTIYNVTYSNVSGPAILIRPEAAYWLESTVSHNINIRNNSVSHCNYGPGMENGTITIEAIVPVFNSNGQPTTQEQPLSFGQVHDNFTIAGNIFDQTMDMYTNHNAISMRAVNNSFVNNNTFMEPNTEYVVFKKYNCAGKQEFNEDLCYLSDGTKHTCTIEL